jgi:hypothetical protein
VAGWNLVSDGPVRGAELLRRLAAGDLPVDAEAVVRPSPGRGREALGNRALQLAALLLALAVFIASAGGGTRLGVNLFTAEVLVFMATLGTLVRTAVRLA